MIHYTDYNSPMSKQHRVNRLPASLLLLLIGALSIIFVFSALRMGVIVSASQASDSTAAAGATSAVNTTKTVESHDLDTGGVVSICASIGGPDSILDIVLAQDVSLRMRNPVTEGATQTRLAASQQAASTFVNLLTSTDRIAVVPFSDTAYLAQPLTTDKGVITRTIFALQQQAIRISVIALVWVFESLFHLPTIRRTRPRRSYSCPMDKLTFPRERPRRMLESKPEPLQVTKLESIRSVSEVMLMKPCYDTSQISAAADTLSRLTAML